MAEKNATKIEEWKIAKIFSLDRLANIRQGLEMKKLNLLSTICAFDPPICMRAATYPTAITMPITQNPSMALSKPGIPTSPRLGAVAASPLECEHVCGITAGCVGRLLRRVPMRLAWYALSATI